MSNERQARVSKSGCGIFLTAAELRILGVEPENHEAMMYSVSKDGQISVDIPDKR